MKISDYIVPIYNKNNEFLGTGFIVENILITAAHVINSDLLDFIFYFKEEKNHANFKDLIKFEYPENGEKQCVNFYKDIAMFNLKSITDSPLIFTKLLLNIPCCYHGYSFNEEKGVREEDFYGNIFLENNAYDCNINKNYFYSEDSKCKVGNSGGPLLQGNGIVGMLIRKRDYIDSSKDIFIKSEYIQELLNS